MRTLFAVFTFFAFSTSHGQNSELKWYSEHEESGVLIQNSFPKGGPYTGPTDEYFNYTYLVFYSRVTNKNDGAIELNISFSAEPNPIPNSPHTFVKLFLPADTMTLSKRHQFSYGITQLASVNKATHFQRVISPGEDCLFYTVVLFYQTKDNILDEDRGGNRAEYILKGEEFLFNMLPQFDSLNCGKIILKE